jgi:hypothetical protein
VPATVARFHLLFRLGLAASVFCFVLAVLRWGPVYGESPWSVRAAPAGAAAVLFAAGCALTTDDRARPRRAVRFLVVALAGSLGALALIVVARAPAGLRARVTGVGGELAPRPPGPIDLVGQDLGDAPHSRKWWITWSGALHVPRTGTYDLWADGRGEVQVSIDGHVVLEAAGERLRAGVPVPLVAGARRLEVKLTRIGPGPRLRLGWTRPSGVSETIPPRYLIEGETRPSTVAWWLTDLLALAIAGLVATLAVLLPWDRRRALAGAERMGRRELAWSAAGHLAIVALMSWPLVLDLAGQGVVDRPDGRLNAWILAWDVHAIRHGRAFFNAPIFHPLPDALAFSENLLLPALAAAPVIAAGGPVLGYNVALLVSLVGSGLAVQLLVRRATDDRLAAFAAGVFFAAGAHRWIRLAHLQAQVTPFLPLALWAFDRWLDKRTWRRALVFGLMLGLQGLSSVYMGAITALAAAVAVGLAFVFARLTWRERGQLAGALALAAALLIPLGRAYLRMREHQAMEWTLSDVATYATTLESYAASGTRLYGAITQRHLDPDRVQDTLFPGIVLLAAGLAGLAVAPPRYRLFAVTASAAAIVFSLGPETAAYRWLHEHVVLVRGVRALSRFSLIPVVCLAVLGGLGLSGRRRLTLAALAVFLVESSNAPIRYARYDGPSATARWLGRGAGAVAYVPLGANDTQAMLDGVAHWRPLVNGDSGFVPRAYTRAMERLEGPLDDDALRLLRAIAVRHVVSHDEHPLPRAAAFDGEIVYDVPDGERASVVWAAPPAATLWTRDGVIVDAGEVRELRRVTFEPDERAWVSAPAVSISADGRVWAAVAARASLADATLSLMRDPRHGLGEVAFAPARARFVRLAADVPLRRGLAGLE